MSKTPEERYEDAVKQNNRAATKCYVEMEGLEDEEFIKRYYEIQSEIKMWLRLLASIHTTSK